MKDGVQISNWSTLRIVVWYWVPVLAWMGMIFYLSSCPQLPSPPEAWLNMVIKKGAHFASYGFLAFLWWRALRTIAMWDRDRRGEGLVLLAALVLTVLYATSDEIHQRFVPGRNGNPVDVLIDSAGALTAVILLRKWGKKTPDEAL